VKPRRTKSHSKPLTHRSQHDQIFKLYEQPSMPRCVNGHSQSNPKTQHLKILHSPTFSLIDTSSIIQNFKKEGPFSFIKMVYPYLTMQRPLNQTDIRTPHSLTAVSHPPYSSSTAQNTPAATTSTIHSRSASHSSSCSQHSAKFVLTTLP